MKARHVLKTLMNLAVFACACTGVIATSIGSHGMMNGSAILYYTIQSNIWIGLTSLLFFAAEIIGLIGKRVAITKWMYVVKYIFIVAITLTMVVFWAMIAPTMYGTSYLLSASNLFAHTLTPLLAIASFVGFDCREYRLAPKLSPLSIATPLYYLAFAIALSLSQVTFNGFRMPYFFLDFYEFSWFSLVTYSSAYGFSSFGVAYWIAIIIATILLIGYGYTALNSLIFRRFHSRQDSA